jgi:hypothetical protein
MYELKKESGANLAFLIGKEICLIGIGSYDVQFNWGNGGISVWWKFIYKPLRPAGEIVWNGNDPEIATPVVRLLKSSITSVDISNQRSLLLQFSNGDQLEIFEDERYESFSVQDGESPIIIA